MVVLANETWNTTQSHSITGEQRKRREADSEGVAHEQETTGHGKQIGMIQLLSTVANSENLTQSIMKYNTHIVLYTKHCARIIYMYGISNLPVLNAPRWHTEQSMLVHM